MFSLKTQSKIETEEIIEETPDELMQQGLSNQQSSLNHQQDQERSEDQGLGRVESQEELGHIGKGDSAVSQQADQKVRNQRKPSWYQSLLNILYDFTWSFSFTKLMITISWLAD